MGNGEWTKKCELQERRCDGEVMGLIEERITKLIRDQFIFIVAMGYGEMMSRLFRNET